MGDPGEAVSTVLAQVYCSLYAYNYLYRFDVILVYWIIALHCYANHVAKVISTRD